MGVRVVIGSSDRDINNIEPNWINEQIGRRKSEGVPVCVRVLIDHGDINISLATSDCPSSSSGNRRLTGPENEVVDLWKKLHLDKNDFSSGNLVVFLKQLGI